MGTPSAPRAAPRPIVLGLAANRGQFGLLVAVNAFVGAVVGLERTVVPLLAEREFHLASSGLVLSFVAAFGAAKALTNLLAGGLSDRLGRRPVLLIGWALAAPVPVALLLAPSWGWVVAANVLLGVSQGLTWSTTVLMKIDLVGPERRGFAMGLNEAAGYLAVAASAFASGALAGAFGLRAAPFYLGVAFVALGLGLSILFVRETLGHAHEEGRRTAPASREPALTLRQVLSRGVWRDPALASANQAGMVNNLNDGVAWGLFPLLFAAARLPLPQIAALVALYPAVWGLAQLLTGSLSDHWGRKGLLVAGMVLQAAALLEIALVRGFVLWMAGTVALGLGTAMVYPTLLAAVGDAAHPAWRGAAVGAYRLWRDGGLAVGAVAGGVLADLLGTPAALAAVAALTLGSGLLTAWRMPETLARRHPGG